MMLIQSDPSLPDVRQSPLTLIGGAPRRVQPLLGAPHAALGPLPPSSAVTPPPPNTALAAQTAAVAAVQAAQRQRHLAMAGNFLSGLTAASTPTYTAQPLLQPKTLSGR